MAVSSEIINYVLRPAKHVERKMLRDTFRRLSEFAPLESYRYIGFGAIYFGDFLLFHKSLGITEMIDIEVDVPNKERYEFNRPFHTIRMMFMASGTALASLDWEQRSILWLDYDEAVKEADFADISTFVGSAISGSALVVSMNVHPGSLPGTSDSRAERLRQRVDTQRLSPDLSDKDVSPKTFPELCRKMIMDQIDATLVARNGLLAEEERIHFQQLFNFRYKDGAPMFTVGGVLFAERDRAVMDRCRFDLLDFLKRDSGVADFYDIRVPNLTYKELHYLDAQLPLTDGRELVASRIPVADLRAYAEIYKYYSKFAEAGL